MCFDDFLFAVDRIPGVKPEEKLLLSEVFNSDREFRSVSKAEVEFVLGRRLKYSWNPGDWEQAGKKIRRECEESGIGWLFYNSRRYPPQLREIYDPPFILYFRGELPDYNRPMLGVVGTRYPSGRGRTGAFRLGMEAGCSGIDVVSGLARGIDLASHLGNVAAGGRTAAVLACGLDRIYPMMNEAASKKILLSGGCLFSEYCPGTKPMKYHFPARNRIISGLSRGVAVVEAPASSGALITADYTAEQGRDIFVHEINFDSPCGAGGRKLAEDGAVVIKKMDDILVEWRGESLSYEKDLINTDVLQNIRRLYKTPGSSRFNWGVSARQAEKIIKEKSAGKECARLMEKELSGELVIYQGEYFRRQR